MEKLSSTTSEILGVHFEECMHSASEFCYPTFTSVSTLNSQNNRITEWPRLEGILGWVIHTKLPPQSVWFRNLLRIRKKKKKKNKTKQEQQKIPQEFTLK